jgi:hypothetical protein
MNLTLLMLVQSLWNVAVAVLLLRRAGLPHATDQLPL